MFVEENSLFGFVGDVFVKCFEIIVIFVFEREFFFESELIIGFFFSGWFNFMYDSENNDDDVDEVKLLEFFLVMIGDL